MADDDATQDGVSLDDQNPEEKPQTPETPATDDRTDFIEDLARRSGELRGHETPAEENTPTADKEKEGAPGDTPPAPKAADKDDGGDDTPTDDGLREIVVDGQKKKVAVKELIEDGIKARQKLLAADKRLEDAARLKKEIEDLKAELLSRSPQERNAAKKNAGDIEALRRDYMEKAQYGSVDEATEALEAYEQAILGRSAGPSKTELLEEIKAEQIRERFTAPAADGGFGDLYDESHGEVEVAGPDGKTYTQPALEFLAMQEVNRLLKSGEPNTWATYKKAGETVRQKYVQGNRTKNADNITDFNKKREEKRKTDNVNPAHGRQLSDKAERELTEEERYRAGVREIQKSRGQL